jgi:hypothetical protein
MVTAGVFANGQTAPYFHYAPWVFVGLTVGCISAWLWNYLEITGWFFRHETAALADSMARLVLEAYPVLLRMESELENRQAEFDRVRGVYTKRFGRRIQQFIAEAQRRGCFSIAPVKGLLGPEDIRAMALNAEFVRIIAKIPNALTGVSVHSAR